MDDKKPTIKAWSYDSENTQHSPELQQQQSANWSVVADGMANDVKVRHTINWYFNGSAIISTLLIAAFISNLLGAILMLVFMSRIVIAVSKSGNGASKRGAVIGWTMVSVLFVAFALFV